MHIEIEWKDGKFPKFNVSMHKAAGAEPFFVVKGCRIVQGRNGEFVSWPAEKGGDGKWYSHCYASEPFATHVLTLAKAALPSTARGASKRDDDDSSIPF